MMDPLFGTDGIRSEAGAYPLDEISLLKLGAVIASLCAHPLVLIGRDTRESGPAIETLLRRGMGRRAQVCSAGVLPTPGLAFLAREASCDFGIMISASHNPYSDNGIKIFDRRGEKLPVALENRINREFHARKRGPTAAAPPPVSLDAGAYERFLLRAGGNLENGAFRLAVDCANGAASFLAPRLFRRLQLTTALGHAKPNGRNINAGCGSTQPAALQKLVARHGAELGLAFDGDADRVIFCDAHGRLLQGDHALFLIARYLRATEPLFNRVVVGTVMSNLGLERALKRAGIAFLRADVGDKHVQRLMKKNGAILGGEPSGHIILRHLQSSGDGPLTALYFMKALRHFAWDASELHERLSLFPQRTLSIRVGRKPDLRRWPAFQSECARFASRHGRRARLLARYSGTEPKLRIMIEARDQEIIDTTMPVFQRLVENEIGA